MPVLAYFSGWCWMKGKSRTMFDIIFCTIFFCLISIWWLQPGSIVPLVAYALDDDRTSEVLIACSKHSENRNHCVPIIYIFRPNMVWLLCWLLGSSNPYRSHTIRPVMAKMATSVDLSRSNLTPTNNKPYFKI